MDPNRACRWANAALLAGAALAALVLLRVVLEHDRIPSGGMGILYHALPSVALLVMLAALRLRPPARVNAALALVSTVVAMYALETGLRLFAPEPAWYRPVEACRSGEGATMGVNQIHERNCRAAHALSLPFDTRSRMVVILDEEARGNPVVPAIHPTTLLTTQLHADDGMEILPLGGIARTSTVYCNESGPFVLYDSDEHGFRNPTGRHAARGVVLVGDSFTKGLCVPWDSTVPGRLERSVEGVLSLGVDGNGPLLQLATFREFALPLQPRTVIWLFYEGNDLQDLELEGRNALLHRYLEPEYAQGLRARQPEIDRMLQAMVDQQRGNAEQELDRLALGTQREAQVATGSRVLSFLFAGRSRAVVRETVAKKPVAAIPFDSVLFAHVVDRLLDDVRSGDGELLFVYLPAWERFGAPVHRNRHRNAVLRVVQQRAIPVVDLVPVFRDTGDPLRFFPFRLSGHYTAEGYGLVAAEIARALSARPDH